MASSLRSRAPRRRPAIIRPSFRPRLEGLEDRAVLAPGLDVLDERERRILHLRFWEGLTQSQIAAQVGISQMHVSRLIRRSLEKVRVEIGAGRQAE